MDRRAFLKNSALAMFGIGAAPAWLARAAAEAGRRRKILVAIFQRGAVDGLNVIVPHGDAQYYALRPTLAISRDSVIDLDGFYGLHPALSSLKPMYDAGNLAVVEATGSPDLTRSHFDAQDYMESGTPGRKATPDGWLNRALPPTPKPSPTRAVAIGTQLPRVLRGASPAIAINSLDSFRITSPAAHDSFESMYGDTVDHVLTQTGRETFEALRILNTVNKDSAQSSAKRYPNGRFGKAMQQIANLIKADVGLEVAFADVGGWDTHVNQGPVLGTLLGNWGQTLAAFRDDLGPRMEDVVVVTMSEFGRTARENGARGTDHGHGNVMFVIGAGIRGGRVYGQWPGLQPEQLHEGRDLAITTDFRDVLNELVSGQLATRNTARIFPGYAVQKRLGILAG